MAPQRRQLVHRLRVDTWLGLTPDWSVRMFGCCCLLLLLFVCVCACVRAQAKDLPIGEIVQKATLKKVLLSEQKVRSPAVGRAVLAVVSSWHRLALAVQALR